MKWHHFFLSFLILFQVVFSQSHARTENSDQLNNALKKIHKRTLWNSKVWHRLGLYRKQWFHRFESFVDGGKYFVSSDGKTNPQGEMIATIEGFFSPIPHSLKTPHPQCRFPARLKWLQSELPSIIFPSISCPELVKYKHLVKAKSVSLVFSSYYMNNPGSTFGHTFLRFNKIDQGKREEDDRNELLDMAFSYGANIPQGSATLATLGGLVGVFPGTLTSLPYYFKVREYNDFEDRDLWSYELNLSEEEVDQLTNIFWELSSAHIDYYFFDDNCAYIILATIEAAAPHLNITEKLRPWVIPADTIKVVSQYPGLVRHIKFRASIRRQLHTRLAQLDQSSYEVFKLLAKDQGQSEIKPYLSKLKTPESRARVLDTLLDNISFLHPSDIRERNTNSYRWKQKVLLARAQVPIISKKLSIPSKKIEQPDLGHESIRLGSRFGANKEGSLFQLETRFAIHDPLDGELGFPKNSQVEFWNMKFRSTKSQSFELLDWALVRVASYTPQDSIKTETSFRMETGIRRSFDLNCDACLAGYFETGMGYSIRPLKHTPLVAYTFADVELSYSESFFKHNLRAGIGPRIGLIYNYSAQLKFHLNGFYRYFPDSFASEHGEGQFQSRWSPKTWMAFDIGVNYRGHYGFESLIGIYIYM